MYLGEERGIGGIGIVRCLVTLRAEADRLTGRRAEGPLLAGYMIVGVGLNITDGGSAFPSPPPPSLSFLLAFHLDLLLSGAYIAVYNV